MSFDEEFVSRVVTAFDKTIEETKKVPDIEGLERQFRHHLARYLLDKVLGWGGHYSIAEILDITCFDDENFPIILIETKWGVELSSEIKHKLRRHIEELGSVKYGVFVNEREFIVYEYTDHKLKDVTKINVAEAVGVAKGKYGLSGRERRRILRLELLKRDRLIWVEDPDYFKKTHKEISLVKEGGVKLLTENLKGIVEDLTTVFLDFFDSYMKRKYHYSGSFLEGTFNEWLKNSMKEEEFKKAVKKKKEKKKEEIIEVFCRETAYVLVGRVLFTRICEDKDVIDVTVSGKGIAESLRYHEKRGIEGAYLHLFTESREKIKGYYRHLHELGFFDWWLIEEIKKGTLTHNDRNTQDRLEKNLNYSIKNTFRRFNRFNFRQVNRDILGDVYQGYLPADERKQLGEFYTPKKVVEYILDSVGYKSENQIGGKKILDPACGSGSFLVEAIKRLIDHYKRSGLRLKDAEDARQIIKECVDLIYGLDIHPFACFIAEMNLLFQLIDLYDVVRKKDKFFKLPRLNVYRTDSLIPPGEGIIELAKFRDNSRRKMLIEETRGANRIKKMEFVFLVGNPPYVRVDNIPHSYREKYKQIFNRDNQKLLVSKWDIYIPFVYKGVKWLEKRGTFGYIVSNKFFLLQHGLPLRKYLLKNSIIEQIIDLSGVKVFAESLPAPAIVILRNEEE